jgi:hypothetical protein
MTKTKTRKEKRILAENTGEEMVIAMPPNYIPEVEEIRRKANEIYNIRMESDIEGTSEDDWYQAEDFLRDFSEPAIQ